MFYALYRDEVTNKIQSIHILPVERGQVLIRTEAYLLQAMGVGNAYICVCGQNFFWFLFFWGNRGRAEPSAAADAISGGLINFELRNYLASVFLSGWCRASCEESFLNLSNKFMANYEGRLVSQSPAWLHLSFEICLVFTFGMKRPKKRKYST